MTKNILILHPDFDVHKKYKIDPNYNCLFDPEAFNEIVEQTKPAYNNFIDELSSQQMDNVDWWSSYLPSRLTLKESSFLSICYLLYTRFVLSQNTKIDIVLCHNKGLADDLYTFSSLHQSENIQINLLDDQLLTFKKKIINVLYFSFKFTVKKIYSLLFIPKFKDTRDDSFINLLEIFIINNMSLNEGDRYYGNLKKELKNGKWFYLPHISDEVKISRFFQDLKKGKNEYLIKEKYLNFYDLIWSLLYTLRIKKVRLSVPKFNAVEVENIIRDDINRNSARISSFESLLNFRFIYRLKKKQFQIGNVLCWFENQNLGKCLIFGLNKFYMDCNIIGYQGFLASNNYLGLQSTEVEYSANVVPRTIAVCGKALLGFPSRYCTRIKALLFPAFRFTHLFENNMTEDKKTQLLITLPIMVSESKEILSMFEKILDKIPAEIEILLKVHPAISEDKIKKKLSLNFLNRVKLTHEKFNELIKKTFLIVSSGSSVIMESISAGIPVIIIGSQTKINHNTVPAQIPKHLWNISYDSGSLLAKIIEISDSIDMIPYKDDAIEISKSFFETTNNKEYLNILN